jgi:cytochrome P450
MNAVVNEGLRKDYGVTSRLPRCAPDRDTKYGDIVIPRGTPVSMSIPDIHDDPKLFPQPSSFLPERWLRDERAERMPDPAGLQRFLVPFSKGSRQCLGLKYVDAEPPI